MSDRIIESFNEMKQIYLGSISGNYIQEGNEYLNYITEGKKEGPGEEYEDKYEKTGKKSKDYDGDGEIEDEADEYAGVKDRAIKKAKGDPYEEDEEEDEDEEKDTKSNKSKKSKKEEKLDEYFSNWRDELYEAIGDIESEIDTSKQKQIVEKQVKNKIEINPSISIAEQIRENCSNMVRRGLDTTYKNNKTKNKNLAETLYLLEKATSEQQQKIFGLALSVKRGDTPRSKVSDEVLKIVDGMPEAEIRKFASTAHKGLPKRA